MVPVNCKSRDKEKMVRPVRNRVQNSTKQFSVPKNTLERYVEDNTESPEELVSLNLERMAFYVTISKGNLRNIVLIC
jgi:hypothetical protein